MKILIASFVYFLALCYILPIAQYFLIQNFIFQLVLFLVTACIPAYITGRMSYVDIAWPWGLFLIGFQTLFLPGYWLRKYMIAGAYLFAGFRMGFGAFMLWVSGKLKKEFPRYDYQKLRWQRKGIAESHIPFEMQIEILVQFFANASTLVIPPLLQGFNSTDNITTIEFLGWILWVLSFIFESIADYQKIHFKPGKEKVMMEGLWKISRHPNYFGEWMVWNSLILSSIPSFFYFLESTGILVFVIGLGLLSISAQMYWCLVYYTGAKPAEYYSVLKRPEYKEYQKTTPMFFPNFFKS